MGVRSLSLILLLGCGSSKGDDMADSAASLAGRETGITSGTDTGPEGADVPSWWTLRADVALKAGLPVAKASRLQVTLLDGTLAVLCEAEVSLQAAADTTSPDPAIYAWWIVEPVLPTGCDGAGLDLPAGLLLGVGEMHPDIQARLIMEDTVEPAALNGAYASLDGGKTLLVYGAAGPSVAWEGEGAPADKAPLDDGQWSLRPVFSFEVSP